MSAHTGWVADPPSAGAIESQSVPLPYTAEDIRRLQRRERAAQNSVEIKARRIVQLEEQVQRWVVAHVVVKTSAGLDKSWGLLG